LSRLVLSRQAHHRLSHLVSWCSGLWLFTFFPTSHSHHLHIYSQFFSFSHQRLMNDNLLTVEFTLSCIVERLI
jgi:hypothetical protein